eukprot:5733522-Prymnesium_polylepis.2
MVRARWAAERHTHLDGTPAFVGDAATRAASAMRAAGNAGGCCLLYGTNGPTGGVQQGSSSPWATWPRATYVNLGRRGVGNRCHLAPPLLQPSRKCSVAAFCFSARVPPGPGKLLQVLLDWPWARGARGGHGPHTPAYRRKMLQKRTPSAPRSCSHGHAHGPDACAGDENVLETLLNRRKPNGL